MAKPNNCWLTTKKRRRSAKKKPTNNSASNTPTNSNDTSLLNSSNENVPPPQKRRRGRPFLNKQEAVSTAPEDTSSAGTLQPDAGPVCQSVAVPNGDGVEREIKVEEPDYDEKENPPVATAGPSTIRQSMGQNTANLPLFDLSGNDRPDLRRAKLEIKTEARSREPSMAPVADLIGAGGKVIRVDGMMKGYSLNANDRWNLETASPVIYPYPRYYSYGDGSRRMGSTKRVLDLLLDGEIDGGGESDENKDYVMDAVITIDGNSALIDWEGYKYPTWCPRSTLSRGSCLAIYNRRMKILAPVIENFMKTETLDSLRKNYPNLMIMQTVDYGEYVKHPGVLYLCGLGKRERQINDFIDEYYGRPDDSPPLILFVDLTDFEKSSIPSFEYLAQSRMTKAAEEINDDLVAKDACCQCVDRCPIATACCSMKAATKISYGKKDILFNVATNGKPISESKGDFEPSPDNVDIYECGDRCKCAPGKCMQRSLQLGCRVPLIVFMHHEKMWTLWTGEDIPAGRFVCSYTGIMMTAPEGAKSRDKMFQMDLMVKTSSSGTKRVVIDAQNAGNEGRFVAHSCDPNLFSYRVHMEIAGRPKRHIGLYAMRDIKAGEELTMDYHIGVHDPAQFHRIAKFICRCGAANCREKAYQSLTRKRSVKVEIE